MTNLCRALIWNACFLELSGDDTIDPDAAVKALEDMAAILQSATEPEKEAFKRTCSEESQRVRMEAGPGYSKAADLVAGLPEAFGI